MLSVGIDRELFYSAVEELFFCTCCGRQPASFVELSNLVVRRCGMFWNSCDSMPQDLAVMCTALTADQRLMAGCTYAEGARALSQYLRPIPEAAETLDAATVWRLRLVCSARERRH